MPRSRFWRADGSASLEFITVGMVMLIPLVYLVLAVAAIQGAAFAAEGAARQAVRVFVQSADEVEGIERAERAIAFAFAEAGFAEVPVTLEVRCLPEPDECLTRLGTVTVAVAIIVPLPLVPPVLTLGTEFGVPLRASATEQVSRFWSAP